ncbi:hypothetical protein EDB81DRAFT_347978 [Dactylonectria macrodidyma]|uniref:Mating-type switching protein swi10 n=1 Tax=Dactylonectria macrodidyma TaxID=307937 RepID=A0A9P9FFX0_9HYPO|nr:hypothetical protein EDB81DRAFT_347978 [Dactylonectria macrodidyma]
MDRSASVASHGGQQLKPARRRLQKCPKLKNANKRGSADSTASRTEVTVPLQSPRQNQNGAPDLSDSKWSHYLRPKTLVSPISPELEPAPAPLVVRQPSQRQIPEFSHLTIQDPAPRPSLDRTSIPSPVSSTSTSSTMRRQAKTPVFRIGQLENPSYGRGLNISRKTSSVDLIADQYRALLESRDGTETASIYPEPQTHAEPGHSNTLEVPRSVADTHRMSRPRSRTHLEPLQQPIPQFQTTTGQDGDLVGFEEDAIYFKPVSFSTDPSPEPSPGFSQYSFDSPTSSRPQSQGTRPPSQDNRPTSQDNLSLQICLDLLTRELSSAMAERPIRNGPDNAALQVWVMIEAYERLRDQVARMSLRNGNGEVGKVTQIFDTWLCALYSIHESMVAGGAPFEGDYSGLESEDLD